MRDNPAKRRVRTMTNDKGKINDEVEATLEIAKLVSKNSEYSSDVRKAARNFLKRKRDQRAAVGPKFLAAVAPHASALLLKRINQALAEPSKADAPGQEVGAEQIAAAPSPKFSDVLEESAGNAPRPTATIVVKSVEEAIEQAEGKHLGDLCGWSLSGSRPKDLVEQLAAKHGLSDDLVFPKLTPSACYKKAISQVFTSGKKMEHMAVPVENSTDKMVHALVTKRVVESEAGAVSLKDAEFSTEIKVGFNKEAYRNGANAAACLVVEDDANPAAVQLKETYLELAETYLANDIRYAFQAAFRTWDACPVLPHGGLWYIPAIHAQKVRSWNEFMIDLGMSTIIIPTFDTVETIASLREATRNGLEGQLSEVLGALDYYSEQGWQKTRTNTLEARVADFDSLRARAELYQNILGTTVDDLIAKVKLAADRLTKDITVRNEADEKDANEAAEAKAAEKQRKSNERRIAREARDAEAKADREARAAAKKAARNAAKVA